MPWLFFIGPVAGHTPFMMSRSNVFPTLSGLAVNLDFLGGMIEENP